jgi:hypothetical protein
LIVAQLQNKINSHSSPLTNFINCKKDENTWLMMMMTFVGVLHILSGSSAAARPPQTMVVAKPCTIISRVIQLGMKKFERKKVINVIIMHFVINFFH